MTGFTGQQVCAARRSKVVRVVMLGDAMDDPMLSKTHSRLEKLDRHVRAALRWNDLDRLGALLQSEHPADVADVIDRLPHPDQVNVFRLLAPAYAAAVLSETHRDSSVRTQFQPLWIPTSLVSCRRRIEFAREHQMTCFWG